MQPKRVGDAEEANGCTSQKNRHHGKDTRRARGPFCLLFFFRRCHRLRGTYTKAAASEGELERNRRKKLSLYQVNNAGKKKKKKSEKNRTEEPSSSGGWSEANRGMRGEREAEEEEGEDQRD